LCVAERRELPLLARRSASASFAFRRLSERTPRVRGRPAPVSSAHGKPTINVRSDIVGRRKLAGMTEDFRCSATFQAMLSK
jgi:hypothetical protein